ncbi:MAG TPA: TPM domain-containing protein [Tepidisphaeraceae bacterium]
MKRSGFIRLALVLALLAPSLALAAVVDNGGFFSRGAVDQANQQLAQVKQQYGRDLQIETYDAIPNDVRSKYASLGKDELYRRWAYDRARSEGVKGAVVVITRNPGHLQVDVGEETRRQAFTASNRDQLRDALLTNFKAQRYDQGLLSAVNIFATAMTQNKASAPAAPTSAGPVRNNSNAPVPAGRPVSHGFNFGKIILWGAIIFLGLTLIRRFISRHNTSYPQRGYGNQPPPMPGQQGDYGYGGGPGYGGYGGGYGGGGGFGRGVGGGILGGLLGGWLGNRVFGQHHDHGAAQAPTDPNTGGGGMFSSGPSDFSSESGGYQDIGGGGDFGGGGDAGGGGGDFGGGGDSGGGGDFA